MSHLVFLREIADRGSFGLAPTREGHAAARSKSSLRCWFLGSLLGNGTRTFSLSQGARAAGGPRPQVFQTGVTDVHLVSHRSRSSTCLTEPVCPTAFPSPSPARATGNSPPACGQ